MHSKTIQVDFPTDLSFSLRMQKNEFEMEIRKMAIIQLFEFGKISSGVAARILGITRIAFYEMLSQYGIDIYNDLDSETLNEDIENA